VGGWSVNRLKLDLKFYGREKYLLLAHLLAPTLSVLSLDFDSRNVGFCFSSTDCYAILDAFLLHGRLIQSLILSRFTFGANPNDISTSPQGPQPPSYLQFDFVSGADAISSSIKEGFGRLKKLSLVSCEGDIRMLVENAPIRDLRIFPRNLF
jgi:hypothetical protein